MSLFIGVDGGGTSTRAVVVDVEGRELGRASVGGAVASSVAPGEAAGAVREAVHAAVSTGSSAPGEPAPILPAAALWAGLAGAGHDGARLAVQTLLDDGTLARSVTVGTDVEAAFHDAFPEGEGILLIAGTGSIAWARDAAGRMRRVGGWGRDLGDEGSGFWLAREGLGLVLRAADGRADATGLSATLADATGTDSVDDLVPWMAAATKGQVAALAPRVIATADGGDAGAAAIVDRAVDELLALVRAACAGPCPPVVLWGGLVAGRGPLGPRVRTALEQAGIQVLERAVDPVMGAAMLARSVSPGP